MMGKFIFSTLAFIFVAYLSIGVVDMRAEYMSVVVKIDKLNGMIEDYKASTGKYPNTISELNITSLECEKQKYFLGSFVYRLVGDKYAVYHSGKNGIDEMGGGDDISRDTDTRYISDNKYIFYKDRFLVSLAIVALCMVVLFRRGFWALCFTTIILSYETYAEDFSVPPQVQDKVEKFVKSMIGAKATVKSAKIEDDPMRASKIWKVVVNENIRVDIEDDSLDVVGFMNFQVEDKNKYLNMTHEAAISKEEAVKAAKKIAGRLGVVLRDEALSVSMIDMCDNQPNDLYGCVWSVMQMTTRDGYQSADTGISIKINAANSEVISIVCGYSLFGGANRHFNPQENGRNDLIAINPRFVGIKNRTKPFLGRVVIDEASDCVKIFDENVEVTGFDKERLKMCIKDKRGRNNKTSVERSETEVEKSGASHR